MSGAYREINYALRPAKNIERKMLCEAFRRLSEFGDVASYRYVGFGSIYFSDFILFHKALRICNMISIEEDSAHRERFLANLPFKCIEIEFGASTTILPTLKWSGRTILWLDYEEKLSARVLTDVAFATANLTSGSVLVVTVNAKADLESADPVQRLRDSIGKTKVPSDVIKQTLSGWGTAAASRRIMHNEIEEALADRNGALEAGSRLTFHQLFNFRYEDGAKMLTFGGVFCDEGQETTFARCSFGDLPFVRSDEDAYLIGTPRLTYRELRQLDTQFPRKTGVKIQARGVPKEDVQKYEEVYRYFPAFTEADL